MVIKQAFAWKRTIILDISKQDDYTYIFDLILICQLLIYLYLAVHGLYTYYSRGMYQSQSDS